MNHAKSITQWRGDEARASGGADKSELRQVQAQRARAGSPADNDVELIAGKLEVYLNNRNDGPFNYEKNLLIDKARYLDALVEGKPFPPFEVEIQMSSKCNLHCRWCIGDEIQERNFVLRLPDNINIDNIDNIIDSICEFRVDGLGIELVKFSGFIGEPLLNKKATLRAIQNLVFRNMRIGLFTNGILMDDTTWDTLIHINYVHISLDAGRSSYFWLKERPGGVYTQETFERVIENIAGLNQLRHERNTNLKINVGYIVVPGNHDQIYETTRLIKEIGADSIRFKCDIGERHNLKDSGLIDYVRSEFIRVKDDFESPEFKIYVIHSAEDMEKKSYKKWKCNDGCLYHNFLATIGSDANIYLCDHNTSPGAISLGHAINPPSEHEPPLVRSVFQQVWQGNRRKYLTDGIRYTCQCGVCPPFGNDVNFFLSEILNLSKQYGPEKTKESLDLLRTKYS